LGVYFLFIVYYKTVC